MTNQTTPAVFNFNDDIQVRTFLDENQNPWFLAKDVCAVLGYKNDSDAIKKHCKEHGVAKRDLIDNLNRKQKASYINEGNLYRLIVKSKKPEAEKFEIWVMEEVLPAIRKTGTYSSNRPKQDQQLIRAMPHSNNERYLVRVLISDSVMKSTVEMLGKGNSFKSLALEICSTLGVKPLQYEEVVPDLSRLKPVTYY